MCYFRERQHTDQKDLVEKFFSNSISKLANKYKLTKHFYTYSKKVLTLNDCYTDWFIKYLQKNKKPINSLVTSY